MADAFGLGFDGSLQHVGVNAFGKHYALRVAAGSIVELAGQFAFLSHQFAQLQFVGIPVFNVFAGYSAFHGSACYGTRYFGDEARVYRFRDEVVGAESKVVHMVSLVYDVGYRLFGQVGYGVYGSQFHFFVDGTGVCIECTAEDVGETDNVIYLIRIVTASG